MKKFALIALAAAAGTASAQFTVTGPATVDSWGALGDSNNGSFSGTYMGADSLFGSLNFTGTLTNPNGTTTWSSEARWAITNGFGSTILAQFQGGQSFTAPIPVNAGFNALAWVNNGDSYNFEAYESFVDTTVEADAVWENPVFTLDGGVTVTNLGILADTGSFDTGGSSYDTELALFTSNGVLIDTNDDAPGFGLQSQINYAGLAVGDYIVVIGGFNSVFVDGLALAGAANGDYLLNLDGNQVAAGVQAEREFAVFSFTVVPSPSSAALLGLGGLMAARRRR